MTQRVRFGLNADPNIGGVAIAERITAIADSHGLELVCMQDHPYNDGFLDTFTLLTWLASKTASVHFVTNVANLPLRPPVMLAKQAATMDVLSGGRFELGLGAGAFWEGIAGMGGPHRAPRTALESLSEAIDILRSFWAGEPFGFRGACDPHHAAALARQRHEYARPLRRVEFRRDVPMRPGVTDIEGQRGLMQIARTH